MKRSRAQVHRLAAIFESLEARRLLSVTPLPNIQVTNNTDVQQQPSLAVDPRDSAHVVIAYMDRSLVSSGYAGIGVSVSDDGGTTWTPSKIPLPAGFDQGAAHPIARYDNDGHLFVSFMAATFLGPQPRITDPNGVDDQGNQFRSYGFTANNGIFVARSDDGGTTWNAPVAVASNLYDGKHKVPFEIKPDLAIDTFAKLPDGSANPNAGALYAVWPRFYAPGLYPGQPKSTGGSNIMIAVSHDAGETWELQRESHPKVSKEPVTVIFNKDTFRGTEIPSGLGFENWAHVTVGPEGDVYVSQFLGGVFSVSHSSDGARSFQHPDRTSGFGFPFGVNTATGPGPLSSNQFRLQSVRALVADPARPGTIYIAETQQVNAPQGGIADEGEIVFARSSDDGATWTTSVQIGRQQQASVINDDNGGQTSTGKADDLSGAQVLPRIVSGANGEVALIWLDTRRDPSGHLLDVFGSLSTDGGRTFSRNFRLTNQSFDADAGAFTDALSQPDFYLGDFLGLTIQGDTAYAAWTDTRSGNQNIETTRFSIAPAPAAPNDRFEPNDGAQDVTDLRFLIQREIPKLHIARDDVDLLRFTSLAVGTLDLTATQSLPGARLSIQLLDDTNDAVLATGEDVLNKKGQIVGQRISCPSLANHSYRLRITSGSSAGTDYSLHLQALTGDFGTTAHAQTSGQLSAGDQAYYRVAAAADGSIRARLTPDAGFTGTVTLQIVDARTLSPLASTSTTSLPKATAVNVAKGQEVLIHVAAPDGSTAVGGFTLDVTNLDQFATADNKSLFFPTGAGPSEVALSDLNGDGKIDAVASNVGTNIVSVMMNSGDGTFQAPREFALGAFQQGGPFTLQGLQNFHRDLRIADLNRDRIPDVVAVNTSSSDVSVLLGRGDGNFEPQRRYDATAAPYAMDVGDVNNDGIPDVAVIDSTAAAAKAGVLLGRGDGSFAPLLPVAITPGEPFRTNAIVIADLNHDGKNDLIVRDFVDGTLVLLGNGDGTFQAGKSVQQVNGPGIALGDLNLDGNLDIVTTYNNSGVAIYSLGNGDGTFQPASSIFSGQFPVAVSVADVGSAVSGSTELGPADGRPDLIVANNGRTLPTGSGPPEVVVLPGLVNDNGGFAGFGDPIRIASPKGPLDTKIADINADGALDVVVVDRDGLVVVYGKKPVFASNTRQKTARDLGTVVHLLQPTLTVVPGREDAWYSMTVPNEAAGDSPEAIDFSANFEHMGGAGLQMEVRNASGAILGSGERIRLAAKQGTKLYVHVFGQRDGAGVAGSGAYTLDIDVLPQVISVQGQPLLPGADGGVGGATASLVLTFQGDRLDPIAAQDAANYTVTWLGPDGALGGGDDQNIAITAGGAQAVVYSPSANVDVSSGLTYPTAVRQTVTLLFKDPLPAGSYRVEVQPKVVVAAFNESEIADRHSIVQVAGASIGDGANVIAKDIVSSAEAAVSFAAFQSGTPFLSQLQSDLGALLDQNLTAGGEKTVTDELIAQLQARLQGGLLNADAISFLALFLDPVSLDIEDPTGAHASYNLTSGHFANGISNAFVSVASNVELVIIPAASGQFMLNVDDVPSTARGGAVLFSRDGVETMALTDGLRDGRRSFVLNIDAPDAGSSNNNPFPINPILGQFGFGRAMFASLTSLLLNSGIDSTRIPQTAASSANARFTASVQPKVKRPAPRPTRLRSTVAPWMQLKGMFTSVGEAMQTYLMKLMKQLKKEKSAPANPGQIDQPLDNSDEKTGDGQSQAPADHNSARPAADKMRPAGQQDRQSRAGRAWPWIVLSAFAGLRFAEVSSARGYHSRRSRRSRAHRRKGGQS